MNSNYSLVVRNKDTNNLFYIPIEDKNNVGLSLIDSLTSKFKDETKLLDKLYEKGYINFSNGDIFIIYKYNNEIKNIEVLYRELGGVPLSIDSENPSKINWETDYGKKFYDTFFRLLKDTDFRKKIYYDDRFNKYLTEKIRDFYNSTSENKAIDYKMEIKELLTRYREFRNVSFFINTYFKNKENSNYEKELNEKISKRKKELNEKYPKGLTKEDIFPSKVSNPDYLNKVIEKEYRILKNNEPIINNETTNSYLENEGFNSSNDELREMIDLDDMYRMNEEEIENLGIRVDGLGKRR